jgi:predicted NBD/HSP70 family sugar kinase
MDETAIRDPMEGVNQSGVRDHNERLVLSLIQRHGGLSSAEIARRSNLSAQTVSIIIRALEKDGLLLRGEPIRGKVGKPSVPMILNPDGILSFGLNIGRRSADLVLIDAVGVVRSQLKKTYPFPVPEDIMQFLEIGFKELWSGLSKAQAETVAGIGVAAPFELWNWLEAVGAPPEEMQKWRNFDLRGEVAERTGLPVITQNDATAACTAEHVFGRGREFTDYAYIFIGSFIGGGIVLNHMVYSGRTGNAGAFGPLPVAGGEPGSTQLLHNASMYLLERKLVDAGVDARRIWDPENDWSGMDAILDEWIDNTAQHLAIAVVAACSVIDFERVLIDANCPVPVRHRIVFETQKYVHRLDTRGIADPEVIEASVGRNARSIGAATLPLMSRFFLNQQGFA